MDLSIQLIDCGKKLKARGLVSLGCNKGSISVRIEPDQFLISPSRLDYDNLTPEELNVMHVDGTPITCKQKQSMDTAFHAAIYNTRPDIQSIIHTHAKYLTALAFAGKGIPCIQYGMKLQFGGGVANAAYYPPGDARSNEEIVRTLGAGFALLLKNHGGLTVGDNLVQAYENMIYLEELSASYAHALLLGTVSSIN